MILPLHFTYTWWEPIGFSCRSIRIAHTVILNKSLTRTHSHCSMFPIFSVKKRKTNLETLALEYCNYLQRDIHNLWHDMDGTKKGYQIGNEVDIAAVSTNKQTTFWRVPTIFGHLFWGTRNCFDVTFWIMEVHRTFTAYHSWISRMKEVFIDTTWHWAVYANFPKCLSKKRPLNYYFIVKLLFCVSSRRYDSFKWNAKYHRNQWGEIGDAVCL